MKRTLTIGLMALIVLTYAGSAMAVIGWAGNAFPNHGHVTTPTGDQFVVAQVWKAGVTDAAGQGPDITAIIRYQTDLMGSTADVAMAYNTDIGSNDEYLGNIPQAALAGASWVDVTVIFTDVTDASTFEITGDQLGNPPLLRYTVSQVLPNPVDVTFQLCMSGTPTVGDPCVVGSAPELTAWATGVSMASLGGDLYEVTVTFAAGSNPSFEYKYRKDACVDWEFVPNRLVVLPTDGTTAVSLPTDSFNNAPLGCGLGSTLDETKTVCFQVCLEGVDNTGAVCTVGSTSELDSWGTGISMNLIGVDLYQVCIDFVSGQPVPGDVEFKFKKDDCGTWESVPNRIVAIDNGTIASQTVSFPWDDGPSICGVVGTEQQSWGAVKARYGSGQ